MRTAAIEWLIPTIQRTASTKTLPVKVSQKAPLEETGKPAEMEIGTGVTNFKP